MSDISTPEIPYIRGTVPEEDDEDDTFPLSPNHGYKVGLDHRKALTVFSVSSTKGAPPSFERASQLDHIMEAGSYPWFDGTVLTLVIQDGVRALELGSHFVTNADNKVIIPAPEAPSCDLETASRYLGPPPSSCSGPGATLIERMMVNRGMMKAKEGNQKLRLPEEL
jgi:hypothetical protein